MNILIWASVDSKRSLSMWYKPLEMTNMTIESLDKTRSAIAKVYRELETLIYILSGSLIGVLVIFQNQMAEKHEY